MVLDYISVNFTDVELDSGRTIAKCVSKFNVSKQWTLYLMSKRCSRRDESFLVSPAYQDCPFKWLSQQHRATFYKECLERYDMGALKKKARSAGRDLKKLVKKIRKDRSKEMTDVCKDNKRDSKECGIFMGDGLKMTKMGISILTLHSSTHQDETRSKLNKTKKEYEEISTLLMLYMKSNEDYNKFNIDMSNFENEVMDSLIDLFLLRLRWIL